MRGYDTRRIGLLVGLVSLLWASPVRAQVTITPAPVPSCVASDTLVYNGATWECAASAVTLPFSDASAMLKDNADAAKLARFELSGITTGNTRVITWPDCALDLSVTTANRVLATGAAGAWCGEYRALVAADIPLIDGSKITGAASLSDAVLSANVPLLNAANVFTGNPQTFNAASSSARIQVGTRSVLQSGGSNINLADNVYFDGSDYRYLTTSHTSLLQLSDGLHLYRAPSGTAGSIASFTELIGVSNAGVLSLPGDQSIQIGAGTKIGVYYNGLLMATWPTTASAANAYLGDGDYLRRSTSSLRYKTATDPINLATAQRVVAGLSPITYRGIYDGETRFPGFAAEEVAVVEPLLVTYDKQGQPDYVMYDRIPAYLVPVVQDLLWRVRTLEDRWKR